ncbi:MAG: hypothetical protein IJL80_15405, partial [Treponema sp.]|nr:hypothetical protein [Treponema sp.]
MRTSRGCASWAWPAPGPRQAWPGPCPPLTVPPGRATIVPMSQKFFAVISRMKYINRWALMRNTISENISEHSLETAFIAHALALIRNRRFGGSA